MSYSSPTSTAPVAEPEAYDEAPLPAEPADPVARLVRAMWALVAVVVVLALIALSGWLRIGSTVNKVACVQTAQTNFNAAVAGTKLSSGAYDLARFGLRKDLKKCG